MKPVQNPTTHASMSLWGGRFKDTPSDALNALSVSTHFDWRLAEDDLAGSKAHAKALHRVDLLTETELQQMLTALNSMEKQLTTGDLKPDPTDEDVHTALERILIEKVGTHLGGKLRAGRSRNDQVVTLTTRYLRRSAHKTAANVLNTIDALILQAQNVGNAVMPGRTHMQHAQPVLVAHHLLAHAWALSRDLDRLQNWDATANRSAYGAGALAGNTLGMDPQLIAEELGFCDSFSNSIDATASRDVMAELSFILAMIGVNLSRLSEEIVIWNTHEFDYVRLDDSFSTGSSIMPQKKNPDIAELARGKAGRMIGDLTGLLTSLKGMPLAYNRDLQEDKEPLFDQIDTLELLLPAFTGMIATMTFNLERMGELAPKGFSLATDIAEWLVRKKVPFRVAHDVAGACVQFCEERGMELQDLQPQDLPQISEHLKPGVLKILTVEGSVASRHSKGGTAPARVAEQFDNLKRVLAPHREKIL